MKYVILLLGASSVFCSFDKVPSFSDLHPVDGEEVEAEIISSTISVPAPSSSSVITKWRRKKFENQPFWITGSKAKNKKAEEKSEEIDSGIKHQRAGRSMKCSTIFIGWRACWFKWWRRWSGWRRWRGRRRWWRWWWPWSRWRGGWWGGGRRSSWKRGWHIRWRCKVILTFHLGKKGILELYGEFVFQWSLWNWQCCCLPVWQDHQSKKQMEVSSQGKSRLDRKCCS